MLVRRVSPLALAALMWSFDASAQVIACPKGGPIETLCQQVNALAAALGALSSRVDAQGARLDRRVDDLNAKLDAQAARLDARIDVLGGTVVTLSATAQTQSLQLANLQ